MSRLTLLTAGAVLVHGYHPFAEDAEIYLPGIEKILHPELFPVGQEFFRSHASLTFFPNLVAFSLRVSHLPFEFGLFVWQAASIFLLLLACWELGGLFFQNAGARWGGVCLVAALLTIPVAGTALYIVDQYLNPRNLAAFAGIFIVARTLEKRYAQALLWLLFAACVHPLMWVFPFSFCVLFLVMERFEGHWKKRAGLTQAFWLGIPLAPASSAIYHEVAKHHAYFYIQKWQWYEWLGLVAPLLLLWWFRRMARTRQWSNIERVSRAFVIYGLIYLAVSLAVDLPARLETLARLQPMRCLHLLYIVMFVMMGGFLAEFVLKNQIWRWLLLLVPLGLGMFVVQRSIFPASAHVEWPWASPKNEWAQAFVWVRQNTPIDALFALDPDYMGIEGEDEIGFRCLAQRSRLADRVKDDGVVSMFPPLAEEWWSQVQAQTPWKSFQLEDFSRLKKKSGVNWVVLQQPGVVGLDCAYQNSAVRICRIP
ncbi:MAG: hypothetical protein JWQ87_1891 [Candidatus Sulfotelmatobacter sp.]|nr:hypothetical protein [Candidatus Sulfotelmatobacter sp.]